MTEPMNPVSPADRDAAIRSFWTWWNSEGAEALDQLFVGGGELDVQAEVGPRVAAVDPRLTWGFGPGGDYSRHLFTVTAGGDPELRPTARRFLLGAPEDGETWSFSDLRRADPSASITWAGQTLEPSDASVEIMRGSTTVGVRLHHPYFAEILAEVEDLPEDDQDRVEAAERAVTEIGFMLLQMALGEEAFGLWISQVVFAKDLPEEAVPLSELPEVVADVADTCPTWYGMEGVNSDRPVHVTARGPLSPLVDPILTRHIVVQLLFTDVDDEGLPGKESTESLDRIGRAMAESQQEDGVFVGAETSDGVRLLHFYVDPESDAEQRLLDLTSTWTEGEVATDSEDDPAWLRVSHLRA